MLKYRRCTLAALLVSAGGNQAQVYPTSPIRITPEPTVAVTRYGAVADNATDIGPALQAAYNANAGCVRIPAGTYLIKTGVVTNGRQPCFVGDSPNEAVDSVNGVSHTGTWMHRSSPAFTPFKITGVTGQGGMSGFSNIGFYEDQPSPTGSSFTAAQYPYWISAQSNLGRIDFDNLNFSNSSACISLVASARTHMTRIMGQPVGTCLYFDQATDVTFIDGIDFWTFWAASGAALTNVFNYNTANVDPIVFARADTPFVGQIFVFGYHSGLKLASSSSGVTTGIKITSLDADASKYGLWVTGNNSQGQIANLRASGGTLTAGIFQAGSEAYRDDSNSSNISIANFQCFSAGSSCVQLTGTTPGSVSIANAELWSFNQDNNASPALLTTAGGTIKLANPPGIVNPANGGKLLPAATAGAFYIGPFAQTFTPTLAGSRVAGTPAYTVLEGDFRDDGTNLTVNFTMQLNGAFTGATGAVLITGLPRAPTGLANHNGYCNVTNHSGIVLTDTGYSFLGGEVAGGGLAQVVLQESGGGVPTTTVPVSTVGSNTILSGSCTYRWN